jgi:geranylgeranyl diphosphate synthase type I
MHGDLAAVRGVVNSLLRQYVSEAGREAEAFDPALEQFWEQIGTVMQAGGKRLRPYLVVLAYEACGGQNRWPIMPVAAAWEMLHQALLIHDDLIDHDTWRHGQPNLVGLYNDIYQTTTGQPQTMAAEATALLAGDLLLAGAQQLILTSPVPLVMKPDLAKLLNYAYQATCYGELLEVNALFRPVADVNTLQVAELKTAFYSVSGPLQSGALLAGASANTIDQLAEIGQLLGMAYQLTDDVLGVFGDQVLTGKSTSSDLFEGKRTRLLQLAYLQLDVHSQRHMLALLAQPSRSEQDVDSLRAIIVNSGAVDALHLEIKHSVDQAQAIIRNLPLASQPKQHFTELVAALTERQA